MKSHGIWRKIPGSRIVGICITLLACVWLVLVAVTWAEAAENPAQTENREPESAQRAPAAEDEYSFKWLDPDKKIYVLQNRKYLKSKRPMLTLMGGPGISNSYRTTGAVSPRFAYYFSEMFGVEAFYSHHFNSENKTFEALKRAASTTLPVVREIRSELGALVHFAPWYAKINVFNQILYFDWYFTGGVGVMNMALDTRSNAADAPVYKDESTTGLFLGTGQLFHISQWLCARLDFSGAFYQATVFRASGEKTWFSDYNFGFGLAFKL